MILSILCLLHNDTNEKNNRLRKINYVIKWLKYKKLVLLIQILLMKYTFKKLNKNLLYTLRTMKLFVLFQCLNFLTFNLYFYFYLFDQFICYRFWLKAHNWIDIEHISFRNRFCKKVFWNWQDNEVYSYNSDKFK